jgi:outer membrane protein with beta-barrel domain
MKRFALALLVLLAPPLAAAELELGIRHVVSKATGDSGDLDVPLSRGFGASAEVFWSKHLSTSAAATFVNPEAILFPSNPPPNDVDLGTLGLDLYSLTARWHFAPDARFSTYAGAGAALVQIGNLDDQFGNTFEAEFDSETTFIVEGGLRYRVQRVVFELGVMYVPLEAEPHVLLATDPNVALPAKVGLDPVIVSLGAAWRF